MSASTLPTFFGREVTGEYSVIKQSVFDGLENYMRHGVPPGGFLKAMLENASIGTVIRRADNENVRVLREIYIFIFNRLPSNIWGSIENMDTFIEGDKRFDDWDWTQA
jgi:hypothetical protein